MELVNAIDLAVSSGDIDELQRLLSFIDISTLMRDKGRYFLSLAMLNNDTLMLEALFSYGATLKWFSRGGLGFFAKGGTEAMEFLLSKGEYTQADLDAVLQSAKELGHFEFVNLFRKFGAKWSYFIFIDAILYSNATVVASCLGDGLSPYEGCDYLYSGKPLLEYATKVSSQEVVDLMLAYLVPTGDAIHKLFPGGGCE